MGRILAMFTREPALNNRISMWAWLLQRITGLALLLYIVPHLIVLSSAMKGAANFDRLTVGIQSPMWHVFDIFLLGAFLAHGFNGLRIIALDTGERNNYEKAWLWAMVVLGAAVMIVGTVGIIRQILAEM